ncbi:MAG: MFS transporter [Pseudomonadota bacterium]
MSTIGRRLVARWVALGPSYLPFADIATPDLTWPRLLRLSLFQVSVGMTLVLLAGTLNRVMIVELEVPALLVGGMLALPLLFAPFRALIGFRSDTHRSELGWRRIPFIWQGTLLQFGGFAIMPFALLVLAGMGESADAPRWIGHCAAAVAFLLAGAGAHMVQTAGLALVTDLTPEESHPRAVGFMYVALLLGMLCSAMLFGWALSTFNPGRLVAVVQGTALTVMVLNAIAMWKQEARSRDRRPDPRVPRPSFRVAFRALCQGPGTVRALVAVGVGTLGFAMADIVIEPFGGQILSLSVSETTRLTALIALGGLLGFAWATVSVSGGAPPFRVALIATLLGLPAFAGIMGALPTALPVLFLLGNLLLGLAAGMFAHATLCATMSRAPADQAGLALGAWGGVQATAAGLAMAIAGGLRDVVTAYLQQGAALAADTSALVAGYFSVYGLEIVLLLVTVIVVVPLVRLDPEPSAAPQRRSTDRPGVNAERPQLGVPS